MWIALIHRYFACALELILHVAKDKLWSVCPVKECNTGEADGQQLVLYTLTRFVGHVATFTPELALAFALSFFLRP